MTSNVDAGGTMVLQFKDFGGIKNIDYQWNEGEITTAYPDTGIYSPVPTENVYYFTIQVPEELAGTTATLHLTAYDESNNQATFELNQNIGTVSTDLVNSNTTNTYTPKSSSAFPIPLDFDSVLIGMLIALFAGRILYMTKNKLYSSFKNI